MEQQLRGYSIRLEGCYKELSNLPVPHQPQNNVNGGSGMAYRAELLIKRKKSPDRTGEVVRLMADIREAGIERLGMMTETENSAHR